MQTRKWLSLVASIALYGCPNNSGPPAPPPSTTPPQGLTATNTQPAKTPPDFSQLGKYPESIARAQALLKDPKRTLEALVPTKYTQTQDGTRFGVIYSIGYWANVVLQYPSAYSLPTEYQAYYPDILQTIRSFTLQSALRDGFADAQITVQLYQSGDSSQYLVSATSTNQAIQQYGTVHPAFLDGNHGIQSVIGSERCEACKSCSSCSLCTTATDPGCWNPAPVSGQPWAMYLPLGLPMLNQKTTLFLDYPPLTALTGKNPDGSYGDYLSNFTMCRWGRVLNAAGASNPYAYETIVDSRPVAAPGSGQDAHLPVPQTTYNSSSTGGLYLNPMLQLLTNPVGALTGGTLPVAVFGYTARQTWGQIVGIPTPGILQVGTTKIGGQAQTTAWISTNHPDVTSYNCCSQDKSCGSSTALVADEQIDFVTACWMQSMAANPAQDPNAAKTACAAQWQPPTAGDNALTECIQEKLDNDNQNAVCCNWQQAWAYCTQYKNNACATLDCTVDPAILAKAPPTPAWQQNTCNNMRFFPGSVYCNRCGGCSTTTQVATRWSGDPPHAEAQNPGGDAAPAPKADTKAGTKADTKPAPKPTK